MLDTPLTATKTVDKKAVKVDPEPIDWLTCITWDGPEKNQPLGGWIRNPELWILDLVQSVIRTDSGKAVDVVMNEDLVTRVTGADGRGILITDPSEGKLMTREEFYNAHNQTDGLKAWALSRIWMQDRRKEGTGRASNIIQTPDHTAK
jgi:hypothetical protein